MNTFVVYFTALTLFACAGNPKPAGEAKPGEPEGRKLKIELEVRPRMVMLPIQGTVFATVQVRITNPTEELWCPEVTVDWGEGATPSSWEGDCPPYDEVPHPEGEVVRYPDPYPFFHRYGYSGEIPITVRLLKSGKTIRALSGKIMIRESDSQPPNDLPDNRDR